MLQTYFRVQPDNLKSINLVQELASYISVLSSQVDSKTITALTQLYSTLTEISLVQINIEDVQFVCIIDISITCKYCLYNINGFRDNIMNIKCLMLNVSQVHLAFDIC